MELKDYISETLVQIVEGITTAKQRLEDQGVIINPNPTYYSDGQFWIGKNQERGIKKRRVQMIDMNVTTTVTESSEGQGGGKINVGILNAGGGLKETDSE